VNTQPPSILVGTRNRTVCVRVEGRGSFLNSTGLKEFAREMTNRGYREFVLDLKACPVMDSTFMGTMAGIALRLREIGQGELRVINLNERNRDLLANLGLDQLFTMEGAGGEDGEAPAPVLPVVPQTPIGAEAVDKAEQAQTMIEAHEACIEANPANAAKFKDVLEYLKQDLHLVR
jgi:anti-anti-sigma factor